MHFFTLNFSNIGKDNLFNGSIKEEYKSRFNNDIDFILFSFSLILLSFSINSFSYNFDSFSF